MIPSRSIIRSSRLVHTTARLRAATSGGKDPSVSQGHAVFDSNQSPQDTQSQHARAGLAASGGASGQDAATHDGRAQQAPHKGEFAGNQEGVGMQEQIGGKSAQGAGAPGEGKGGQEEASPPGWFAAAKSKLGLGTSAGEVKQNRGGGEGVTGTGTGQRQVGPRGLHTSAVSLTQGTRKAEPDGSRQPKDEHVAGEQSPHLTHKKAGANDHGRGNAAAEPALPSKRNDAPEDKITNSAGGKQQVRRFATSARAGYVTGAPKGNTPTEPGAGGPTTKLDEGNQLEGASPLTGENPPEAQKEQAPDAEEADKNKQLPAYQRDQFVKQQHGAASESVQPGPNASAGQQQQRRSYHASARWRDENAKGHSAESYFKDVDDTAPPDSKTHAVAYGEEVQRASEPPSGEWSRKGAESKEYQTVSQDEPYSPPAPGAQDEKLRYGNREEWGGQPGKGAGGTSHPGEGPEGTNAGGRKPERA
ncbi:hypothetical protein GLOTRDRAFT_125184 [Gloeophyllum trabeum ATCC 11539]|uniref:Uncharacterized protein n=1 Tax=Gloeophyllum trabeum (strain ATCC 11539 / FP-39264 / Madison 617) TaxID=670483 RepID=S7RVN2_GLOTA|nr:uncharacterized protein GLOTRDRAFT_125184 [Gloeophyllum trabeum ATCC 11539]EPQ58865.1 hypothetical protein GLOTRDRAFT_125184 [Gloeophyllum trabeum ATCC 11539]